MSPLLQQQGRYVLMERLCVKVLTIFIAYVLLKTYAVRTILHSRSGCFHDDLATSVSDRSGCLH